MSKKLGEPNRPDDATVQLWLNKIVATEPFKSGESRHAKFLSYVVMETLAGRGGAIKERNIGTDVFQRPSRYDPRIDPIVRVEAGRLRQKLSQYYESDGASDLVKIRVPKGTYVPVFHAHLTMQGPPELSNVFAIFGAVKAAINEERWNDLLSATNGIDALARSVPREERHFISFFRFNRLVALGALNQFDDVRPDYFALKDDLSTIRDLPGQLSFYYPSVLQLMLFLAVQLEDSAVTAISKDLWQAALERPEFIQPVTAGQIQVAKTLAEKAHYGQALDMVIEVLQNLQGCSDKLSMQAELAEASYLKAFYYLKLDQFAKTVEQYRWMEEEFKDTDDTEVLSQVAWAGTEAARALRSLKRNQEADALARSLSARFSHSNNESTRRASAWAAAEISNTLFNAQQYDGAIECISRFLAQWDTPDQAPNLRWPLIWAYAQREACYKKMKRYEAALQECDSIIARWGDEDSVDVQAELAWVLMERVVALRRGRRLAASLAAAQAIATRFSDSSDRRILEECIWAEHAAGDVLLCEAKILKQSGLHDDARDKLDLAHERFAQCAAKAPTKAGHLGCKAYAEFLLDRRTAAEASLKMALSLDAASLDGDDWSEQTMFIIPEDAEFAVLVARLRDKHRKKSHRWNPLR